MTRTEYGYFSDEGCLERQVYAVDQAEADAKLAAAIEAAEYDVDDQLQACPMCQCGNPECEAAEGSCEHDESYADEEDDDTDEGDEDDE